MGRRFAVMLQTDLYILNAQLPPLHHLCQFHTQSLQVMLQISPSPAFGNEIPAGGERVGSPVRCQQLRVPAACFIKFPQLTLPYTARETGAG